MSTRTLTEYFVCPSSPAYTHQVSVTSGCVLVSVEGASGAPISGCTISDGGLVTVPSGEAGAALWVTYTAPGPTYSGSKAQAGRGSTLSIGATPTEIGEMTSVPFNRPEWDFVDVTNFDSTSDQEMLPTIRKAATFSVKGNRVATDAGQLLVEAAYASGALNSFTILLPKTATQTTTGDKYLFNAYVKGASFDVAVTKQVEYTINLQTSGPITYTAGS